MTRKEIINYIEDYVPNNYHKLFWLLLPCTVILFPLSWLFLFYIQYFAEIDLVRITQLTILTSFVLGFVIGLVTIMLVDKTDLSSNTKMIVILIALISMIFCPLAFAIASWIATAN